MLVYVCCFINSIHYFHNVFSWFPKENKSKGLLVAWKTVCIDSMLEFLVCIACSKYVYITFLKVVRQFGLPFPLMESMSISFDRQSSFRLVLFLWLLQFWLWRLRVDWIQRITRRVMVRGGFLQCYILSSTCRYYGHSIESRKWSFANCSYFLLMSRKIEVVLVCEYGSWPFGILYRVLNVVILIC